MCYSQIPLYSSILPVLLYGHDTAFVWKAALVVSPAVFKLLIGVSIHQYKEVSYIQLVMWLLMTHLVYYFIISTMFK